MAARALTLVLVLALAACAGGDDEEAVTTVATGPVEHLTLYYLEGEHLRAVPADVVATGPSARSAVDALLANEGGRPTAIPEETELNGVSVVDRTATVDLSREFESGGGSASMQARVAQVVYTLTQWQFIRRVTFELDGEPVEAIGGEGVPARNLLRRDLANALPPIFVDPPLRWAASPLSVAGSASVFEGTVSLRLEANGKTIAEGFATASEGGPGRGPFSTMLEFDVDEPTNATLVAFERSAEDGSETNVVRMPVRLCSGRTNLRC
jgi:germination protein M